MEDKEVERIEFIKKFHKERIDKDEKQTNANIAALMLAQDSIIKDLRKYLQKKIFLLNQNNALKRLEDSTTDEQIEKSLDNFLDVFNEAIETPEIESLKFFISKDIVFEWLDGLAEAGYDPEIENIKEQINQIYKMSITDNE